MSQYVDIVEYSLDRYVRMERRRGIDPEGVRAVTLAHIAGIPRREMSIALQEYRLAQGRPDSGTRYVIAAQQYGRLSRWNILSKPGTDPVVVRENRREHCLWIVHDAVKRLFTDHVKELNPSLTQSQQDQTIDQAVTLVERQFDATVQFVEQTLR